MTTEGFEQYFKLGKSFLNPWNDMGKTLLESYRRVNEKTLEIMGENLSRSAEHLKRFSKVKRPDEFFNLQKECFNEHVTALMNDSQKFVSALLEDFENINKSFTSLKEQQTSSTFGTPSSTKTYEKTYEKSDRK